MSKASDPIPDSDALGDFAKAAAATARAHLRAADSLLQHHHWPQARALAVLAFEEAGKAWLCVIAMLAPDDMKQHFPFRDLDWNHQWKLAAARSIRALLDFVRGGEGAATSATEAVGTLELLAREDNQGKLQGLYTDYRDGAVWSPSDITEEQARAMVAVVTDVLDNAGPVVDLAISAWMSRQLPEPVADFFARGTEALEGDDDTMGRFIYDELGKINGLAGILGTAPNWLRDALTSTGQTEPITKSEPR